MGRHCYIILINGNPNQPKEVNRVTEPDGKTVLLLRNLKDAGCDTAMTEQFLAYEREKKTQAQRRLLLRQRDSLLRAVQERSDCLDFLLYSVEGKIKTAKGEK